MRRAKARRDLAYERLVVTILTRAREGAAGFADDLQVLGDDIDNDPTHPLHGRFVVADLIWSLTQFGLRCAGAVAVLTADDDQDDPLGDFLHGYSLERELSASAGGR